MYTGRITYHDLNSVTRVDIPLSNGVQNVPQRILDLLLGAGQLLDQVIMTNELVVQDRHA